MGKKPNIVVVDDEQDILDNYIALLSFKYEVKAFLDPNKFLDEMDSSTYKAPDLVITDLKMPPMDGLEMIRRAQKKGHYFPFILLSGFLSKTSAIEAVDIGVYRLLEKPTEFSVLSSVIDQLLLEHDIRSVRLEIRQLVAQLRELYSGIRMALTQYIPPEIMSRLVVDAPDSKVKSEMSFDELLEYLESRLETLLASEKVLDDMRHNKMRA